MSHPQPTNRPQCNSFGSGPCAKRPGFSLDSLNGALLGRSHRSVEGKAKIVKATDLTRQILKVPESYLIAIVPASDTGAFEMAMWNLLGPLPVDVCWWETFGKGWLRDAKVLGLEVREFGVDKFGKLPSLEKTSPDHDIVFTWNGTTSGVKVPNADWISNERKGLTLCDATSAVFAMEMPWEKLDVVTFSWQKVLGGEAAHGILILSPRAKARCISYTPQRPIPKILQLKSDKGEFNEELFKGSVINTVSLLAVEDYLDGLNWAIQIGGLAGLCQRSADNLKAIEDFVEKREWISFLSERADTRSNTSVCLVTDLSPNDVKEMTKLLTKEKVAYDIDSYRDAPTGLRIWCGATVQLSDLKILLEWLEWAYHVIKEKK